MEWLRRAAQLQSNNYWYQYFLAYLEDKAGSVDLALRDYSIAITHRPDSHWVRFSRARLYRSKGRWETALEDMQSALKTQIGRPEAAKIELELGYLYYALGDFASARSDYDHVIELDNTGLYGPAARLNRANIDAELGSVETARSEYDALLSENYNDVSARFSRALLELRQHQAERAMVDCNVLLEMDKKLGNPEEVLTTRAMAFLMLGRAVEAMADATKAQRVQPSPTHERLRQRTILAARRLDLLQLDWPDEIALLPLGGRRSSADLQSAITGLDRLARTNPDETVRASLALAVILAGVGRHEAAIAAADRALVISPFSPRGFLIRARRASSRATSSEHATTSAGASRFSSTSPVCSSSGEFSRHMPASTSALSTTTIWRSLPALSTESICTRPDRWWRSEIISAAVQEWSLALTARPRTSASLSRPSPITHQASPMGHGTG